MSPLREDIECVESRLVHRGKIIDLSVDRLRLPGGRFTELEIVHHRGAAAVVPLLDDGRVALLRQFRWATGGWLLEIPAGKLEGDEEPESCAHRELAEEAGQRLRPGAGELLPLGWIWTTPGFTDEKIWLYLARGLETVTDAEPEEDEVFHLHPLPLEEAVAKAAGGEIHDSKTACALLRAARLLGV